LRKALPVDSAGMLDRRAQKLLRGIARSKAGTVPANALDLAAWSELNDAEAAGAEIVVGEVAKLRQRERTPRKFVRCLGCDKRFLARRKNHVTCSSRCQRRANRKTAEVGPCLTLLAAPLWKPHQDWRFEGCFYSLCLLAIPLAGRYRKPVQARSTVLSGEPDFEAGSENRQAG
jgi:hypothetical protein